MTKEQINEYTGASIEVLEGLEPVRRRPGMYTDTQNPNHLGMEVIDNSVDEALAGFATKIEVNLYKDGSLEVIDNGRGMPVDMHPTEKIPAIELIFSRLHAGGKFSNDNYAFSGGLHGVGVSVVNALSKRLEAKVSRDGQVYSIVYSGGEKIEDLKVIGTCPKSRTGTAIRFWPDEKYFDGIAFNVKALTHLLRAKAVLCKGLSVVFKDENSGKEEEWHHEGSLSSYLLTQMQDAEIVPDPPFDGSFSQPESEVEWAVTWNVDSADKLLHESFVNLIPTPEGGTHVNGFRSGLLIALREFCDLHALLPRNLKLVADDVWAHCSFVLAVKIQDPQFAGQTKEKLSSRQCASLVEGIVKDAAALYFNSHTEIGKAVAKLIIESAKRRESAAKVVERKKSVRGPQLPGKLVDCTSTDPSRGELFIVEGDSAGGSARQARDSSYQAILPLRGKILNTWEVSANTALASEEIRAISVAMGLDPDSDDLTNLRYDKICILADADSDGLHIGTLLCALFVKHFPALVRAGHVYVACPPLYRLDCGKIKEYALDDEELALKQKQFLKRGIKAENIKIQRFKGLGEMNPEQLRETTLSPDSRRLMQLTLEDLGDGPVYALMDMLLSKKRAADRRQWLEKNGDKAELID
ncbi:DNA topoisomerase IV subunit B [Succinatimonas hippei]|uniref:DNA topoisomerase 4 subunit B n=1 Tax=Succinatimonas hippei (strain DSM 22608 / JCM 16073 / KCTC 15190 / YIT 12066) TaxID=762983 RepID=E8LKZ5_SUCHY|nr:DNA topoisomerase IV subunit B [Succinatimonas hippei]EFY06819.1 DNA topoisomerase IV, B subunit [Succinatimonas hippei YIT 12066]